MEKYFKDRGINMVVICGIEYIPQKQLMKELGMSKPTFYKFLKKNDIAHIGIRRNGDGMIYPLNRIREVLENPK